MLLIINLIAVLKIMFNNHVLINYEKYIKLNYCFTNLTE